MITETGGAVSWVPGRRWTGRGEPLASGYTACGIVLNGREQLLSLGGRGARTELTRRGGRLACGKSGRCGLRPDRTGSTSGRPCNATLPTVRRRDGNCL